MHKNIADDMYVLINERLCAIEKDENVRILFAVESGSRAWGFPSPDSDYDVRFVYVRPLDWYLSLNEGRDVIQLPIEGELDINGWDLKKALRLLIKPNPVLMEWLCSPIVYRADQSATAALRKLADEVAVSRPPFYHYLHLADSQFRRFIEGKDAVKLKKYFYVLRPVMALVWLKEHPHKTVPMTLPELRAGIHLPEDVERFVDELLQKKITTKELGLSPRVGCLDRFIKSEVELAKESGKTTKVPAGEGFTRWADELFRAIVKETVS